MKFYGDTLAREVNAQVNADSNALLGVGEWNNPAATNVAGLRAATSTSQSAVALTAADLLQGGVLTFARTLVVKSTETFAHVTGTVTFTGFSVDGQALSETVTPSAVASAPVSTSSCFKSVTGVAIGANAGTGGKLSIGWGIPLGLEIAVRARAGYAGLLKEIVDGSLLADPTGSVSTAATNPPHGAYTPSTAPNGSHDYAIYYDAKPV